MDALEDRLNRFACMWDMAMKNPLAVNTIPMLRDAASDVRSLAASSLEAENAKLRERVAELEELEDGKRYIPQEWYQLAMTENTKLRELCTDMFDGMCDHDHCYTCHHWQDGYNGCKYHERMAQLGIEVD